MTRPAPPQSDRVQAELDDLWDRRVADMVGSAGAVSRQGRRRDRCPERCHDP
ncbi:MAG: hypothetical protein ACUVSW_18000 [Roseiflexus sp.]